MDGPRCCPAASIFDRGIKLLADHGQIESKRETFLSELGPFAPGADIQSGDEVED